MKSVKKQAYNYYASSAYYITSEETVNYVSPLSKAPRKP